MGNMSQVQAAEISPTQTNREWEQAEMEFQDRAILCVDCGQEFVWTAGEQLFFHDKGLKNERLAAIANAQASGVRQRIEVSVQCAQCGQATTVPFYPSQGRPVYCRSCFIASRNADGYDD